MELKIEILGHERVKKSMRVIDGRLVKPSKPLMESIGKAFIEELRRNIRGKGLLLEEPHKDRRRGQLMDSIHITRNTGRQVKVGPGPAGFFGKWLHFGVPHVKVEDKFGKQSFRKAGIRFREKWSYISDQGVDKATKQIKDFIFGQPLS